MSTESLKISFIFCSNRHFCGSLTEVCAAYNVAFNRSDVIKAFAREATFTNPLGRAFSAATATTTGTIDVSRIRDTAFYIVSTSHLFFLELY